MRIPLTSPLQFWRQLDGRRELKAGWRNTPRYSALDALANRDGRNSNSVCVPQATILAL